jgi:TonB family protein
LRLRVVLLLLGCAAVARAQEGFTPPRLIAPVEPRYPAEAEAAGREATVVLELTVDTDGKVSEARPLAHAGFGFDEAALEAARQLRFEPGRYQGTPVSVKITWRQSFTLRKKYNKSTAPPAEPPVRLSGELRERGTRLPLDGAAIIVTDEKGEQVGQASSRADGRFEVRLPESLAGRIGVLISAPDHRTLTVKETISAKQQLRINYTISRTSYAQYEATVRGSPPREEVARVSLEGEEIRRIPGTRGDALAAVLNLPSVARSPFDLGQLILRGSQPGESGAFVNGMGIPQAFHFALGTSTFNSFLLERFDLIQSNFSVRYGRFVGGVVDIVPRAPKTDRWHGDVKIDLYDAHLIAEGPVGKGGIALSVRRSYIDAVLGLIVPNQGFTVAPRYYDYQGLFDYPVGGGKLKLILFGSDDELSFVNKNAPDQDPSLVGRFSTHFYFHSLQARYEKKWQRFELDASLLFSGNHTDGAIGQAARFNLDVIETDARLELRYRITPRLKMTAGVDVQTDYFWVTVDAPSPMTEEGVQPPIALEQHKQLANKGFEAYPAVYLQGDWKITDRIQIIPGVRFDWFAHHMNSTYAQPRMMMRFLIADQTWLKAGAGLYAQPPQAPFDDAVLGNPAVRPEQAWHILVGVESRPFKKLRGLSIDFNLFYKDLRHLPVGSTNYTFRNGMVVPELYTDEGIGRVYGGDILIKQDNPRWLYGWIAYSLLKSERQDHPGDPWRPFQYDQTHILTVVLGYHLPRDFDLGLRLRYVTGNPDTSQLANGLTAFDSDHNAYFPGVHAPFATRLPDFFQLDLRVDKRFVFKSWIFAIYLDIANVTNRGNVEGYAYSYDFTRRSAVTGLPILPSLGLRASF